MFMRHWFSLIGALALASTATACQAQRQAARSTECRVHRVVDGDSMECDLGRQRVMVRLLGIDAPELAQPPFGRQSRAQLERLLRGREFVALETDVREKDQYGRVLAYVWSDTVTMVNLEQLRAGYAVPYILPPNVKHSAELRAASSAARKARAGLWSSGAFDCSPSEFRRRKC